MGRAMALSLFQRDGAHEVLSVGTSDSVAQARFFTDADVSRAFCLGVSGTSMTLSHLGRDLLRVAREAVAVGGSAYAVAGINVAGDVNVSGDVLVDGVPIRGRFSPWDASVAGRIRSSKPVGIGTAPSAAHGLAVGGRVNHTGSLAFCGALVHPQQWARGEGALVALGSNVGIRVARPTCALDVGGNLNFTGTVRKNGVEQDFSQWDSVAGVVRCASNAWVGLNAPASGGFGGVALHVEGDMEATAGARAVAFVDAQSNVAMCTSGFQEVAYDPLWNGEGGAASATYQRVGDTVRVTIRTAFAGAVPPSDIAYSWALPFPALGGGGGSVTASSAAGGVCVGVASPSPTDPAGRIVARVNVTEGVVGSVDGGGEGGGTGALDASARWGAGDSMTVQYAYVATPERPAPLLKNALSQDASGVLRLTPAMDGLFRQDATWRAWSTSGRWTDARFFSTGNTITVVASASFAATPLPTLLLPLAAVSGSVSVGTGALTVADGAVSVVSVRVEGDSLFYDGPWAQGSTLSVSATYLSQLSFWPGDVTSYVATDELAGASYDPWGGMGGGGTAYRLGDTVRFFATFVGPATLHAVALPAMPAESTLATVVASGRPAAAALVRDGELAVVLSPAVVLEGGATLTVAGEYRAVGEAEAEGLAALPLLQDALGNLAVGAGAPAADVPHLQVQGSLRADGFLVTASGAVASNVAAPAVSFDALVMEGDASLVTQALITPSLYAARCDATNSHHATLDVSGATTCSALSARSLRAGSAGAGAGAGAAFEAHGPLRVAGAGAFPSVAAASLRASDVRASAMASASVVAAQSVLLSSSLACERVVGRLVGSGADLANLTGRSGGIVYRTSNIEAVDVDLPSRFSTTSDGGVGIGTAASAGIALDVGGDVVATSVRADAMDTMWRVPYEAACPPDRFRQWTSREIGVRPAWMPPADMFATPGALATDGTATVAVHTGDNRVAFLGRTVLCSDGSAPPVNRIMLVRAKAATFDGMTFASGDACVDRDGNAYVCSPLAGGGFGLGPSSAWSLPAADSAVVTKLSPGGSVQGLFSLPVRCSGGAVAAGDDGSVYVALAVRDVPASALPLALPHFNGSASAFAVTSTALFACGVTAFPASWVAVLKFGAGGGELVASSLACAAGAAAVDVCVCAGGSSGRVHVGMSFTGAVSALTVMPLSPSGGASGASGPRTQAVRSTSAVVTFASTGEVTGCAEVVRGTACTVSRLAADASGNLYVGGTCAPAASAEVSLRVDAFGVTIDAALGAAYVLAYSPWGTLFRVCSLDNMSELTALAAVGAGSAVYVGGRFGGGVGGSALRASSLNALRWSPGGSLRVGGDTRDTGALTLTTAGPTGRVLPSSANGGYVARLDLVAEMPVTCATFPTAGPVRVAADAQDGGTVYVATFSTGATASITHFDGVAPVPYALKRGTTLLQYDASGVYQGSSTLEVPPSASDGGNACSVAVDGSGNLWVAGRCAPDFAAPLPVNRFTIGADMRYAGAFVSPPSSAASRLGGTYVVKHTHALRNDASTAWSAGALLPDGRVLYAAAALATFMFDPASMLAMSSACVFPGPFSSVALCGDGRVLVPGLAALEAYDPVTDTSSVVAEGYSACGARSLPDGRVFLHGASHSAVFSPFTGALEPFAHGCGDAVTCVLPDGRSVLALEKTGAAVRASVWDTVAMTCNSVAVPEGLGPCDARGCTLLPDGDALLFAGAAVLRCRGDGSGMRVVALDDGGGGGVAWGPGRLLADGSVACPQGTLHTGQRAGLARVTHPSWAA